MTLLCTYTTRTWQSYDFIPRAWLAFFCKHSIIVFNNTPSISIDMWCVFWKEHNVCGSGNLPEVSEISNNAALSLGSSRSVTAEPVEWNWYFHLKSESMWGCMETVDPASPPGLWCSWITSLCVVCPVIRSETCRLMYTSVHVCTQTHYH